VNSLSETDIVLAFFFRLGVVLVFDLVKALCINLGINDERLSVEIVYLNYLLSVVKIVYVISNH